LNLPCVQLGNDSLLAFSAVLEWVGAETLPLVLRKDATPHHAPNFLIESFISTPIASTTAQRPSLIPIEAAIETAKVAFIPKLVQESLTILNAATPDYDSITLCAGNDRRLTLGVNAGNAMAIARKLHEKAL
jgi:hypothetical protein